MTSQPRTIKCGEVRPDHVGQFVVLHGWAHRVRDLGGLYFIDLRDRTGVVQLFIAPEKVSGANIRPESCLKVYGRVEMRSPENINPKIPTGEVDVVVESFEVLNPSKPLPFPLSDEEEMRKVNEELRVKYRYLDLRRPKMHQTLQLRAAAVRKIRAYLDQRGFVEVETPIITRSTPEGARDYLVPYRLDPGRFYALPQSPQQYKQLLMVAGVERYYQIAKCFRDEAQRADRQPEFTQLDLEMSFVKQEDIMDLTEGLTISVINELIDEFDLPKDKVEAFEQLSYAESMRLYGNDKPDLRFGLPLFDLTKRLEGCKFSVFRETVEAGGVVRGVRYPDGSKLSRKDVAQLEAFCKEFGAKGMASLAVDELGQAQENSVLLSSKRSVRSSIAKFFTPDELDLLLDDAGAEPGDLLCLIADTWDKSSDVLARLRNHIGDRCGLCDPRKLKFAWIVDFPLVEWNEEEARWDPKHHPFTSPKAEDMGRLASDPASVRADCYDVVCNGVEWASGSIRIHHPDIQKQVFELIGIDEATQRDRFGHMLEAFEFGAPPHGGIAPGIDRLLMFLLEEQNIREVIAFPKLGNGYDPMMDAPSAIDARQWSDMGLELAKKPEP